MTTMSKSTRPRSAVGELRVRRALPREVDGPSGPGVLSITWTMSLTPDRSIDVAPHPHMGCKPWTWLFAGEFCTVTKPRVGGNHPSRQLNLMTSVTAWPTPRRIPDCDRRDARNAVVGRQPSTTRDGGAEFEHFDTDANDRDVGTSRRRSSSVLRRDEFTGPSRQRSVASNSIFTGPSQSHWSRNCEYALIVANARCWSTAPSCNRGPGVPRRGTRRVPFRFKCSESGDAHRGRSLRRTPLHVVELCGEVPRTESPTRWPPGLRVTIVLSCRLAVRAHRSESTAVAWRALSTVHRIVEVASALFPERKLQ